jgi:hypothetical protein
MTDNQKMVHKSIGIVVTLVNRFKFGDYIGVENSELMNEVESTLKFDGQQTFSIKEVSFLIVGILAAFIFYTRGEDK